MNVGFDFDVIIPGKKTPVKIERFSLKTYKYLERNGIKSSYKVVSQAVDSLSSLIVGANDTERNVYFIFASQQLTVSMIDHVEIKNLFTLLLVGISNIISIFFVQISVLDSAVGVYPLLGSIKWTGVLAMESKLYLNSKIFPFRNLPWGLYMFELYNSGARIVCNHVAYWSLNKRHEFQSDYAQPMIWERRSNLSEMVIKAGAVSNPPKVFLHKFDNNHIELDGTMSDIFKNLQEILKFK